MKFKLCHSSESIINHEESKLPFLYKNKNTLIEGTDLTKQWKNNLGDDFLILGEIIGKRLNGFKLTKIEDYSFLEEKANVSLVEGRFIIIKISNKNKISVWSDQFGRADIYWVDNGKGKTIITSGMDLIPTSINKGEVDQNALAQLLTIYGSRPLKKHTLYKNIRRLGIQESLTIFKGVSTITKKIFEARTSFSKDDTSKLDDYSDIFIEAVRARSSETQNIIFLSSGWDSTSILATLAHLGDVSKIECIIGRMRYSKRSEIINQFELDRAQKMADYYNVKLHIVELDYTEKSREFVEEALPIFQSQEFANLTGLNHWLLAKGAKKIAKPDAVVFAGEISDGAHNLGFSQYFSIYHPASQSFREYSDKMASYLWGPTFLSQLIEGKHEEDPVWKIFKSYNKNTKFDKLDQSKKEITAQLLSTFFLSGGRIPLYSKANCNMLSKNGRKLFLKNGEETYLKDFEGKVDQDNIYSHYLHLYHSFHWQGGTVATLEHMCDAVGLKCRLPFIDKALIDFLSEMPESWGRGLDINNTKYPLKWMLSNRVDYPMDFQQGPHSYLYDVNPSFSHSDEILNASSFTKLFKELLAKEDFIKIFDPEYFDINYIKEIVSKLLSSKNLVGQEITDMLNIGNLIAFKLV